MPRYFRPLPSPTPKKISEGDFLLSEAKTSLKKYGDQAANLLELINNRQQAFYQQINSLKKEKDKQPYICAYIHFARNLKEYLAKPNDIDERIDSYHSSGHYYNVGGENNQFTYGVNDEIAECILTASLLCLLVSFCTLPLHLITGIIILSICVALIVPSLYYHLAVTRPNASQIKKEEKELFLTAEKLVNPQEETLSAKSTDSPNEMGLNFGYYKLF